MRVAPTEVVLTGEDGRVWTGTHAVAADGARSAVRGELGIPMEGRARTASMSSWTSPICRAPSCRWSGSSTTSTRGGRPQCDAGAVHRGFQVDLQCRDDDAQEAYGTEEAVREWLPAVVGDGYAERILWVSTYRFLRKVAASFSDPHRRVLLVGEAAHLFRRLARAG